PEKKFGGQDSYRRRAITAQGLVPRYFAPVLRCEVVRRIRRAIAMGGFSDAKAVAATGRWVLQVLGVLLGAATLISFVKSGFAIELSGLPAKLHANYVWTRNTLFEPLVRWLGWTLPWWAKDLVVSYALLGAAHGRALTTLDDVSG